ncbi:hypothetical protein HYX16_04750 [Candidatus Woesearchaeota archaeon]|nr:hypothetical protein [Candidatus Woesearchaeota archaeon]
MMKANLEIFKKLYAEHLKSVDQKYHDDFVRFVEAGESSEEFLAYLDKNKEVCKIIDKIAEEQVEAMRTRVTIGLKNDQPLEDRVNETNFKGSVKRFFSRRGDQILFTGSSLFIGYSSLDYALDEMNKGNPTRAFAFGVFSIALGWAAGIYFERYRPK